MASDEVRPEEMKVVDRQGRITLPTGFAGAVVKVEVLDPNTVIVRRAVVEVVKAKVVSGG